MRRKRTEVPNLAQGSLALEQATAVVPRTERGRQRFVEDSPGHLHLGNERLDAYLQERGLGWVVRLRQELERVDWTSLEAGYEANGRRPYHPRTVVGLIVYGMLCRQWSLRELEALAVRDMGAWWICGGLQPDHSTIGEFVRRHQAVLSEEFFVELVKSLVGRAKLPVGMVAGDGTVVEAAASHHRLLKHEAAEAALSEARAAAAEAPQDGARQQAAEQAELVAQVVRERSERSRARGGTETVVAASEPEAVLQPRKDGARRPAYKPSLLMHEAGLIVGQQVHPSSEVAVVESLLEQHRSVFGQEPSALLLDAGYQCAAVLEMSVARNIDVLCAVAGPQSKGNRAQGRGYDKTAFRYDTLSDAYLCPGGQRLRRLKQGRDREQRTVRLYGGAACGGCVLREQCTRSCTGRTIKRYDGDELKELMAAIMRHPVARRRFGQRRSAERPFAEFRQRQGLTRFHRRGSAGVRVEFALHCIAFDLKWALGHFGGTGRLLWSVWIAVYATEDARGFVFGFVAVTPTAGHSAPR